MIPLFKPSTARQEVNKTQGDGELAKLANLNRLVENVNTIVAQGIPAAGPTLTYSNIGPLDTMFVSFNVAVDPTAIPNSGGSKTVQSYYVPQIGINNNGGVNSTLTSITFPDIEIGGYLDIQYLPLLNSINLPSLTKLLTGGFVIKGYSQNNTINYITDLNASLLDYVAGNFELQYVNQNISYPRLTQVGGKIDINSAPNCTSVSFPLLTYVGGQIYLSNLGPNLTIDLSSLLYADVLNQGNGFITIEYCDSIDSIDLSGLVSYTSYEGIQISNIGTLGSINLSSLITAGQFHLSNVGGITNFTIPSLTTTNQYFQIQECDDLTTINLPLLSEGGISFADNPNLTTINVPELATDSSIYISGNNSLTSVSLPSLATSTSVYISGDSITSISLPALTTTQIYFEISGNALTTFSAPNYIGMTGTQDWYIQFSNCNALTSISLPSLSAIDRNYGQYMDIANCSSLESLSVPSLTSGAQVRLRSLPAFTTISPNIGNIQIDNIPLITSFAPTATYVNVIIGYPYGPSGMSTISAPNATTFNLDDRRYGTNPSTLTSLSAPVATNLVLHIDNDGGSSPTPLTSVNFPSATTVSQLYIRYTELTTLDLSTVVNYNITSINLSNNPNLTSVTLGTIGTLKDITLPSNYSIDISTCALNEASVNGLLALLVSLDGTNGTTLFNDGYIQLSGGTNAAPTGQGLTDKATLISRGVSVTTN